jgi:hypothetical protein
VVDQNSTHERRGHGQEVRPIRPIGAPLIDQPQVRLVNQRGRLKGMIGSFVSQLPCGERSQFAVDEWPQCVRSALLAGAGSVEQLRQVLRNFRGHAMPYRRILRFFGGFGPNSVRIY